MNIAAFSNYFLSVKAYEPFQGISNQKTLELPCHYILGRQPTSHDCIQIGSIQTISRRAAQLHCIGAWTCQYKAILKQIVIKVLRKQTPDLIATVLDYLVFKGIVVKSIAPNTPLWKRIDGPYILKPQDILQLGETDIDVIRNQKGWLELKTADSGNLELIDCHSTNIHQPIATRRLHSTGQVWIGRDSNCNFVILKRQISRLHARIIPKGEGNNKQWVLHPEAEAKNGTWKRVNSIFIDCSYPVSFKPCDFKIGSALLVLSLQTKTNAEK